MIKRDLFLSGQEAVLDLCDEISRNLLVRSNVDVHLQVLGNLLGKYFQKQDKSFLEAIAREHKDQPHVLKMLEFWEVDLKEIKIKIFAFFELHLSQSGATHQRRLSKDFLDLTQALKARFTIERNYLLPILN